MGETRESGLFDVDARRGNMALLGTLGSARAASIASLHGAPTLTAKD